MIRDCYACDGLGEIFWDSEQDPPSRFVDRAIEHRTCRVCNGARTISIEPVPEQCDD
jgi:hypothetical protein